MSSNFADDFRAFTGSGAPLKLRSKLKDYGSLPVAELCNLREPNPGPRDRDRHRIYALMLMALLYDYWNGNKRGRGKRYEYPWNDFASPGQYLDSDYQGHNIGAIAVNSDGRIAGAVFSRSRNCPIPGARRWTAQTLDTYP